MLRKVLVILLLASTTVFGMDYNPVDAKIKEYPYFSSLEHLSIRIMNDFESDAERVRAAFVWIVYNMDYGRSYDVIFRAEKYYPYYSEIGRKYQMRQLELEKIDDSFRERLGVCLDYSLILKELCNYFEIPSEIIIGVAKTEIRDLKDESLLKNHSWNAALIDGNWKLMDPTWAAGHMENNVFRIFEKYADHFFFTDPEEFVKTHLPVNPEWQLLENTVDVKTFSRAPSYLPAYFVLDVKLSENTSGIISLSDYNEYLLRFEELPVAENIHYMINGSGILKKMEINKSKNQPYYSIIKLRKGLKHSYNYLTVFLDYKPILRFRIDKIRS